MLHVCREQELKINIILVSSDAAVAQKRLSLAVISKTDISIKNTQKN